VEKLKVKPGSADILSASFFFRNADRMSALPGLRLPTLSMTRHHFFIILGAAFYGWIIVFGRWFDQAGFSLYEISLLVGSSP